MVDPETPGKKLPKKHCHVLIFDSLLDLERHRFIAETLGEYLRLEYNDKKATFKLPGREFRRGQVKRVIPDQMPQQKNYIDCGLFLLHFAELFLTKPPEVNFFFCIFVNILRRRFSGVFIQTLFFRNCFIEFFSIFPNFNV